MKIEKKNGNYSWTKKKSVVALRNGQVDHLIKESELDLERVIGELDLL